jgi:hypothetical protein
LNDRQEKGDKIDLVDAITSPQMLQEVKKWVILLD